MAKGIYFARYRPQEELGEGGIGYVLKVFDLWEQKEKALKFLKPEFRDSALAKTFQDEFFLLGTVAHPGVVSVYDYHAAEQDQGPAYALELVKGYDLLDYWQNNPDEQEHLGFQICRVLEFLHLQGIVHCDLKPDNFKVTTETGRASPGAVKLLDFGLAESAELIKEKRIKGTLGYMAPEILRSEEYNHSADLYSLGVILYRLYTGRLPHQADDPALLISQVLEEEPKPLRSLNDSVPPELETLVMQLLDQDPQKRIAAFSQMKSFYAEKSAVSDWPKSEWQALLQSGKWIPPFPVWEELLSLIRQPAVNRKTLAVLFGSPGIGKSRLLAELKSYCQKHALPVFHWQAEGRLSDSWKSLAKRLLVLGSNQPGPEFEKLNEISEQSGRSDFYEYRPDLAAQIICQLPLAFLIDDFDFQADSEFLKKLCQEYPNRNSTVILSARTFPGQATQIENFIHSRPETEKMESFRLQPLGREESKRLLEAKLPGLKPPEKLLKSFWDFSGGNSGLGLAHLSRLWQEGALAYRQKLIKVKKSKLPEIQRDPLPDYYRTFIESSLDQDTGLFLSQISVFEQSFDLAGLLSLTGAPVEELYERLGFLLKEGLISVNLDSVQSKYRLSPPSLRDHFYPKLPLPKRQELHQKVAACFEEQKDKGLDISDAEIAYHYARAGLPEKAYQYSYLAIEEALKSLDREEVLLHSANALAAANGLKDSQQKLSSLGQVLRKRAHFWKTIGNFQQALAEYRQLLRLFDKNSQHKILAGAYKDLGDLCRLKNSHRKGMVYLRRAEQIYRTLGDQAELAHTLNNIGNLYWISLQYDRALEHLNSAFELHQASGNLAGAGSTLNNLAGVYLSTSQYDKSIEYYQKSLEIHRKLKIPEEISRVLNNLGVVYMYTSGYREALDSLTESLSINKQTANLREEVFNLENLGECYQKMGHQVEAVKVCQQGLRLADQIGFTLRKGRILRILAQAHFELGEYSMALESSQKALQTATQIEDSETQTWVWLDLARLYLTLNVSSAWHDNLSQAQPFLKRLDDKRACIYYCQITGEAYLHQEDHASALTQFQQGQKLARENSLLEEELACLLDICLVHLKLKHPTLIQRELDQIKELFLKKHFSRHRPKFLLLQALYHHCSGQTERAIPLLESGLQKAQSVQNWEEAAKLAYWLGHMWLEKKNYEAAYLTWEKGVSILKNLYQNIKDPDLRQAYLTDKSRQILLTEFRKIATLLVG
jgi:tetratricopeptide (TPR) repeat protein